MTSPMRAALPKILAFAAAAALALAALSGCQQQNVANEQQNENRQYMAQVNQVMDDLDTRLSSFTDAVSRDDVVGMQTQADDALSVLDDLGSIEAPEALADVKQGYVDGAALLREALTDYVALYTEIHSATEAAPFDWSAYDERLAAIQEKYDEGIAKLQETDQMAAGMEASGEGGQGAGQAQDAADASQQDAQGAGDTAQ